MKVWFGCTSAEFMEYKKYYYAIRDELAELGCIILYDWLELAEENILKNQGKKRDIKAIYKEVTEAVVSADIVVIEHTVPNFSSAHQINLALMRQKPTLVLKLKNDNKYFSDSYLEAIESPLLTIKQYDLKNYKSIIKEFVGLSAIGKGQGRYNVVLDRKQKHYLDWAATIYKKSRSLIIRDAIDKVIGDDEKYNKYVVR